MISFTQVIPTLRMFDVAKAKEFYVDYLGCKIDFEHRFEPDTPLFIQVSRDGLVLQLSEHFGDGTPGSVVFVWTQGLDALHHELREKKYRYLRPGIERQDWGRTLQLIDPFGNRLRFTEAHA
jgi:catechol 2,3-dioxygenase-like lactoylglutathione lyase family enzyme